MTIEEALKKDILLDYQKAWVSDHAVVKVWEKSRRIGASYVEALYSVLLAALSKKRRRHELLLFVVRKRDDAAICQ